MSVASPRVIVGYRVAASIVLSTYAALSLSRRPPVRTLKAHEHPGVDDSTLRKFVAARTRWTAVTARRIFMERFGSAVRPYLLVLAFLSISIVLAAAIWIGTERQETANTDRVMDWTLSDLQLVLDQRGENLENASRLLSGQPAFVGLVLDRDGTSLTSYLEPLVNSNAADNLIVTDRAGAVISQLSGKPSSEGNTILSRPEVEQALSGHILRGIIKATPGSLALTVMVPVYDKDGTLPIGVLIVQDYLDDRFTSSLHSAGNAGLEYVYADEGGIYPFSYWDGSSLPVSLPPPIALPPPPTSAPATLRKIQTTAGERYFKFTPIKSLGDARIGWFGVEAPVISIQDHLRDPIVLVVVLNLAIACLFGFVAVRYYLNPLESARRVFQRRADGKFAEGPLNGSRMLGLGKLVNRLAADSRGALEAVTKERNHNEAIIRSLGAAVIVTDKANRISSANPAAELLLKDHGSELIGRPWYSLFFATQDSGDAHLLDTDSNENGGGAELGRTIRRKFFLRRDRRVALQVSSRQLIDDGPTGYVHLLEDASEQEEFIRAKDEFLMNAAHEFRAPLTAMRGSIDSLIENQSTLDKRDLNFLLRNLQQAVIRFQAFSENLIDIGNVIAGRFVVRPYPCELRGILDSAISQIKYRLDARGQTISSEMECTPPCRVFADRERIVQVLVNLISNASKYGPEDQPILISVVPADEFVVICVVDKGPGIDPSDQAEIFKRYYRGKRARTEGLGLGIGLALSKEIVEAHGGQIGFTSEADRGTTFWFSLLRA